MDPADVGATIAAALQCLVFALTQRGTENVLVALADEIGNAAPSAPASVGEALRAIEELLRKSEL